ncbi:hypothetical protein A3D77_03550 [Candidatus Gottesmanbacteria bacterium RIFCSPHIGHO2_02_FULL_39_11]|uniref:HD domain-containing protein n=1 Tax=Candidatus Gottesmanbacteria bacterium RIFCSPHIGHO2_02_FULL_39_11 TaxID=1798382 RepID=A0A1F5ZN73_9BACT|nr:MAG: hypothetical protein A3D77_03550 [Candidatus Gottesmanbacteria bacterium RIFCSPHIGHO2_02_FULL_39_11]
MTRDEALKILDGYVTNINLEKHMFAVEASLRGYARKFGENEDMWGLAGLLHDADWEKYPDKHPQIIIADLKSRGTDGQIIQAIASHGNNSPHYPSLKMEARSSKLDHAIFACDELCGFIIACALIRPDRLDTLDSKSVLKKMKNKAFAKQVNREDIIKGAKELGIPLEEHISFVITCLKEIKSVFGF